MSLIEVQANVLLHTDTGLRIVYIPAVPKVEVHPVAGGHYEFRQPDSDPASVWRAIREHAISLPSLSPSSQLAASLLRELLAAIHGDGGHHAEEYGLVESTRRAAEIVSELKGRPAVTAGGIVLRSEMDDGWLPPHECCPSCGWEAYKMIRDANGIAVRECSGCRAVHDGNEWAKAGQKDHHGSEVGPVS